MIIIVPVGGKGFFGFGLGAALVQDLNRLHTVHAGV
jgi:hypothetical protein